jgi:hypothetical protein
MVTHPGQLLARRVLHIWGGAPYLGLKGLRTLVSLQQLFIIPYSWENSSTDNSSQNSPEVTAIVKE